MACRFIFTLKSLDTSTFTAGLCQGTGICQSAVQHESWMQENPYRQSARSNEHVSGDYGQHINAILLAAWSGSTGCHHRSIQCGRTEDMGAVLCTICGIEGADIQKTFGWLCQDTAVAFGNRQGRRGQRSYIRISMARFVSSRSHHLCGWKDVLLQNIWKMWLAILARKISWTYYDQPIHLWFQLSFPSLQSNSHTSNHRGASRAQTILLDCPHWATVRPLRLRTQVSHLINADCHAWNVNTMWVIGQTKVNKVLAQYHPIRNQTRVQILFTFVCLTS